MENQISVKEICSTTAKEWVKNGALLVDVREKEEVEQLSYDVPNIINIPLSEFEERFNEIPKDREVVMVCRSGVRSLRATGFLINNGYDNQKVVNMKMGIINWVQKGFPTKGDTSFVLGNKESSGCCNTPSTKTKNENSCCCKNSTSKQSCCCSNSKSDETKCC